MDIFWDLVLVILGLSACGVVIGLAVMAITACLGQAAENIKWFNDKWGH